MRVTVQPLNMITCDDKDARRWRLIAEAKGIKEEQEYVTRVWIDYHREMTLAEMKSEVMEGMVGVLKEELDSYEPNEFEWPGFFDIPDIDDRVE
jgi:hypothetical protein